MLRDRRDPELDRRELLEERRLLRPIEDIRRDPLPREEDEELDEPLLRHRLRER